MNHHLFLDESGECSFSRDSLYKYFLITVVSVDDQDNKEIKRRLKPRFASLIRAGWPKTEEIKASKLFKNGKFRSRISEILTSLVKIASLKIHFIVVKKENITSNSLRNADYGIAYNYFAGVLLSELVVLDSIYSFKLIYDERNKETHSRMHFRDYIETLIHGKALETKKEVEFTLQGMDSDKCYGLSAVDFFSWAIFRKFEYADETFFCLFDNRIGRRREWYIR